MPIIGGTISHYRILEKLGGGGMGVVYKGREHPASSKSLWQLRLRQVSGPSRVTLDTPRMLQARGKHKALQPRSTGSAYELLS